MSNSKSNNPWHPLSELVDNNLQDAQEHFYNHWQESINHVFGSLDYLTDVTHQTVDHLHGHINRAQNDSIDYFFTKNQLNPFIFTKENTPKKDKQVREHVALVTGGIGGIGTAICERLYEDGNRVIATYISMEKERALQWQKEFKNKGLNLEIVECDVTDFNMCKRVASKINKEFGRIDILVNCAGITRDSMLRKMEPSQWDMVLKTNLDSVFNMTKSVLNGMVKRKYGRIINISSVNGQKGQFGQTNYATAKAGMIGFSRSLAIELADTGVTVNSVCPGYVGTSMVESIRKDVLDGIVAQIPMGRLAKPSEIAASVSYLAQKSSAYVTGSEISVNGGLFTG